MTDLTWFIFMVWIIFFVLGFKFKKDPIVPGIAGVMGIVMGVQIYSESTLLFLVFMVLGFYSIYIAAFSEVK